LHNKAFIDVRRRPGVATPLAPYGPLRPNATSSIKPEVHNISQRHHRTEPRPRGICTKNFVAIGEAVPEICSRAYRQTHTDRQTDRNTPLPCRDGIMKPIRPIRCLRCHHQVSFCIRWLQLHR